MNEQNKKVPTVRFKGFTNDWEQHKLGEVCEKTYSGLTGKNKQDFGHGKAKYITYLNVHDNAIATTKGVDQVEIDPKQNEVVKGDLLFTVSSEVPEEVALNSVWPGTDNNVYLNSFCFGMRPMSKSVNSFFLTYYLRSPQMRRNIYPLAQGISRFNISKRGILSLTINLPNIREQINVYKVIKNIECLVTLQQQKLDLLKQLKKGLLQKMFADKDAKHPVLRFNGYSGDWEQRKLGDIAKIVAGGDKDNSMINSEGRYPVIANSVNTDGIIGYYSKKFRIKAPAITVTGRGDIGNATPRFINFTPVVRLLALTTPHNVVFIANAINKIRIFNESTGVPQLTAPQLSKYKIGITDYQEESIIAGLISTMEIALSLQQQKLAKYQSIKKSLLQQMFI